MEEQGCSKAFVGCESVDLGDIDYAICTIQAQVVLLFTDKEEIKHTIKAYSLLDWADKTNVMLINDSRLPDWLDLIPCFWVDNATSSVGDFNNKANSIILERNRRICNELIAAS